MEHYVEQDDCESLMGSIEDDANDLDMPPEYRPPLPERPKTTRDVKKEDTSSLPEYEE